MLTRENIIVIGLLAFLCVVMTIILNHILRKKHKNQLDTVFTILFVELICWMVGLILQVICVNKFGADPIYFDYFVYIPICFMPVALLFLSLIFAKTKIKFKKIYYLLFIVPITSLIMLWTNNLHHLFYEVYSTNLSDTVFGKYFPVHSYYTYILVAVSVFILLKYSIKNSGFFSKQATLIIIGTLVPVITNVLGLTGVISMSIYATPITYAVAIICFILALYRFDLLKVTPIALQRIVDRISDSYVILNDNYQISDFNATFTNTFNIKKTKDIRGELFSDILKEKGLEKSIDNFYDRIKKVENSDKTESFEFYIEGIKKYFNIEITSIIVNGQSLGTLVLFKDITQHIKDMQTLKNNQDLLVEQERLASLGQMIGGIAHNLKTPIMSIAGASEGIKNLVDEFDASIGNPVVNNDDFHEIANDMRTWLTKINSYTEYMSDILTAVKGQAVTFSKQEEDSFTIGELFKRINILMKHELKNAVVYLNICMEIGEDTVIKGNVNSLVQVINNMISNAIQAYNGKPEQNIDLIARKDNNNIIISVKDYGCGLPDSVKNKLFKEMITTKGKNGTGLGLYMSYSTIKANFNGTIKFESEKNKGSTFDVILPIQ